MHVQRVVAAAWVSFSLVCATFAPVASAQSTFEVTLRDGSIQPAQISVRKGDKVTIHVTNAGANVHNFVIRDFYVFSNNLHPGEDVTVGFTPDKTGRFPFYSDKAGRPEPGMRGTLTVR
ncbi:cupredoxin domain-containing protein [Alicyclobacillus pomorum]|uniref:cupredoxin domain-containing protein n=1 Tax=Alicyclobacillus pomorum TaxID=204470 RepID=UPI00041F99AE|nr:cupredoxin domain-containing protein [Alicyclobacillus pomorum]